MTFLHDDLYYQQGGSISSSSIAGTPAEENEGIVMSDEAARIMSRQAVKEAVDAVLNLPPRQ